MRQSAALVLTGTMPEPRFIHLRLHSEYSITDGIVRLEDAVRAAARDGQGALALTDLGNVFGWVKFYQYALRQGVKPTAGCDVWITNPGERDQPSRLLLLVRNARGYLNLCELLSRAWLTNVYQGRAEIAFEWLESGLAEGLIALSGAQQGDIGLAIAAGNMEAARQCAQRWARLFPDCFYIEVQRADQPEEAIYIQHAVHLAVQLQIPLAAAHEARVCIAHGERLAYAQRRPRFSRAQYFRTQAEMCALFADLPSALANSVEIAKRCTLTLELGKAKLPLFPTPEALSLDAYLRQLAGQGLEARLEQLFADADERGRQRPVYAQRLAFECDTIIEMGFAGYFLIVADFINWAKNSDIPVGPGRGSGAGSLVAFALGITDLDPLRYNLLFERFLNPERVSMPDFDIDFCPHGRDRVIQYVRGKYGHDAVTQIVAFGTMAARAAVRDIGRVLDLGYTFTDGIAKLIPFRPGRAITIADALKEEPQLAERCKNEEEVQQLLTLAQRVEGLTRNVGMHAGGVLIAPGKLTDFCPLYAQSGQKNANGEIGTVSQYDKDDVEAIGLVKFDLLGLTTLTILDWVERDIRRSIPERARWSLKETPLDDASAFEVLQQANTIAVFQFEGRGMQALLKDARPDHFEDIIALVSLYRPGPMELIPSFCARKHGDEKIDYPDPRVESILSETYGIMVYQEQVMQMAQIIGGYTLGGADLLRRAMGKKKPEEMAQHRALFRDGAAENGLSSAKADEIFNLIENFAGYGFNKSHAAAYALLAYYTAWLKAHYPVEFMAANLSLSMDNTDRVKILVEDCAANRIMVLPPDINQSRTRFLPLKEKILYGLGAIKGSGQSASDEIVRARADQPFQDIFDFCRRVDRRIVNRRALEALIRAGSFDALHANRAQLLASAPRALETAEQTSAHASQGGLFDDAGHGGIEHACTLADVSAWPEKQRLQEEKAALGFYLSGHPFDLYKNEARRFVPNALNQLTEGAGTRAAGIIRSLRAATTQRGKMWIVMLDDGAGQCEITLFDELAAAHRNLLTEDALLIVAGSARHDAFSGGIRIIAESVMDLKTARSRFARALRITFDQPAPADTVQLREWLSPYRTEEAPGAERPTGLPVQVHLRGKTARATFLLGASWRVIPCDELLRILKSARSVQEAEILY